MRTLRTAEPGFGRDMRIGYARVSTEDQPIDLQKDALKRARWRETYEERATGKNTSRPQLEACFKSLREGDTFVAWRIDRKKSGRPSWSA